MKNLIIVSLFILIVFNSCSEKEEINPEVVKVTECSEELVLNTHDIEGYTDRRSYYPGDNVKLFIHCPTETFSIDFLRNGKENITLESINDLKGEVQNYSLCSYQKGCNWKVSYEYTIPDHWPSGMYSVNLKSNNGKVFFVTFIVKNPTLNNSKLLVVASTNTWQAYNNWGGASFYNYELNSNPDSLRCSTVINFQRPNPRGTTFGGGEIGHLAKAEMYIIRWLENNSYNYDMICDEDLHNKEINIDKYNTVLLNTHSEYYSKEMYDHLEKFLGLGGNLCYLSGNGIYWKVTIDFNQMEFQPDNDLHIHTGEQGGRWRDIGRPESSLLGVQYTSEGYNTFAGFEIKKPNHWVFSNTGLVLGDIVGEGVINIDGASGHETDKMTSDSPENCILLAKGANEIGGAEMVYYETHKGAKVFSVGSITFGRNLAIDKDLSLIMKNILDEFLLD